MGSRLGTRRSGVSVEDLVGVQAAVKPVRDHDLARLEGEFLAVETNVDLFEGDELAIRATSGQGNRTRMRRSGSANSSRRGSGSTVRKRPTGPLPRGPCCQDKAIIVVLSGRGRRRGRSGVLAAAVAATSTRARKR
jgi:hypothetical protein